MPGAHDGLALGEIVPMLERPDKANMSADLILGGVVRDLSRDGFAVRRQAAIQEWLGPAWFGWDDFSASWSDLPEDRYMADGGRYRARRYAVFEVAGGVMVRAAHQPHFQARAYNRLNGGTARWFAPVKDTIAGHPITNRIVAGGIAIFEAYFSSSVSQSSWRVELHQFRIAARAGGRGLPTPEGVHRDGVEGVIVMMVGRENVDSGVTEIFDPDGRRLGMFTLSRPCDAVVIDDTRIFHGVTPILPLDPNRSAIRDVLVVTFQRHGDSAGATRK